MGTIPASGGGTGASGASDRTGRLALGLLEGQDPAVADSLRLDQLERAAMRRLQEGQPIDAQLAGILDICDRWAPTERRKQALDNNLRAAANDDLNRRGDTGNCLSCRRLGSARFNPPHKKGLCKSCDRWLNRTLELYDVQLDMPKRELLELAERRGANSKVTDQDIHIVMHGHTRRQQ